MSYLTAMRECCLPEKDDQVIHQPPAPRSTVRVVGRGYAVLNRALLPDMLIM
jgi:hypothetical protein